MRWIKGLIPTVIILLGALLLGCICYISIWGVPSFVVQRVEQALLEKGIPSHIETLKVTLWPRAVVTLKNVELLDPEAMPETRRPIVLLHEADVALNWKKLIEGQVVPERVNVKGMDVSVPVDAGNLEKVFSVTGVNAPPRYRDYNIAPLLKHNEISTFLAPETDISIMQQAWFSWAELDRGIEREYQFKGRNTGVYIFVIEGEIKIGDAILHSRDGAGITDTETVSMEALQNSTVLLMEVAV